MVETMLQQLLNNGKLRPLDLAFGQFIAAQESQNQTCLALLAAYLSKQLGEQDSCVDINFLGQPYKELFQFPETQQLLQILTQANSLAIAGQDALPKPMVLDGSRLYLQRYWHYENKLASKILKKARCSNHLDLSATKQILQRLFPTTTDTELLNEAVIDYQKVAVCVAASQQLSLITGGPGTGKTTTVTRLMALLQGLAALRNEVLNIHLVAPTGKAAARLTQSIANAKKYLPEDLQKDLPEQCKTIHRLLGALPYSPYFRFNEDNPLHLDVLVVDEASMVDLPLMSKLFAALPEHAQVILLGDKDQLASVEAGSVLSDICAAAIGSGSSSMGSQQPAYSQKMLLLLKELNGTSLPLHNAEPQLISDNLVILQKSHRFSAQSGVGQLAKSINQGNYQQTLALLNNDNFEDIHWHANEDSQQLVKQLMPAYRAYFKAIERGDVMEAFNCLARQQVLCAQRNGEWGVVRLNMLIEKELYKQGLLDASRDFYPGRPIMLSQNDHILKLFNGDIGLVMADPQQSELLKVWFFTPEGQIRSILPSRLPPHETVYAMTIHKSQGSEFTAVYLCLPNTDSGSVRGLNRELLYTGLTRAKQQFTLYASKQALQISLQQQCRRGSGLASRLI
jgi:exodeoxyribonuclease V alpha subunit